MHNNTALTMQDGPEHPPSPARNSSDEAVSSKSAQKRARSTNSQANSQRQPKKAKVAKKTRLQDKEGPGAEEDANREDEKANLELVSMAIPEDYQGVKMYLWAENALTMFQRFDGGCRWLKIVKGWFSIENARKWSRMGKQLETKGRPFFIGNWVQRARKPRWRGFSWSPEEHAAAFWKWWRILQPDWRLENFDSDDEGDGNRVQDIAWLVLVPPEDEDWEDLCSFGPNGMLSVVAVLYFWGRDIDDMPEDGYRNKKARKEAIAIWNQGADNVLLVLTALANKYMCVLISEIFLMALTSICS